MKTNLILLLCLFTISTSAQNNLNTSKIKTVDLKHLFYPYEGSFVLLDLNNNEITIYNDSLASERFSPCSSFKIVNSLISIESGVAKDGTYKIAFDSASVKPQEWWYTNKTFRTWLNDHTMKTAIENSVVWYYQELARRMGEETMSQFLKQIDYGNNNISSGIDRFWLCGSLKVSAKEQIQFLKKLYNNELVGFSKESQELVKKIIPKENGDAYKLYGKTGSGDCFENKVIGWYVGFVETQSGTCIFALNMFGNEFKDVWSKRKGITKAILKELGVI